jgi:hypothetical protein
MKGITIIPSGPISEEAKIKLKKMMEKRDERLRRMVEDYKNNKL